MLKMQMNGEIDAWAIRCAYSQFSHLAYTVAPKGSMVNNIGHDGSGTNCGLSSRFDSAMGEYDRILKLAELPISRKVEKAMRDFCSETWYVKFKQYLKPLKTIVRERYLKGEEKKWKEKL